jgi:hypothetical protein
VRAVLAFTAASVCIAGCGALLDLPDDPQVAKDERARGRRGQRDPAALLIPPAPARPSGGPVSVSSRGPDITTGRVNDAGADRQPIASSAGEIAGAMASPERDAGLGGG